ncbi:MAG: glycosyltransferase [Candidatus Izemoplasmatales bacterium]
MTSLPASVALILWVMFGIVLASVVIVAEVFRNKHAARVRALETDRAREYLLDRYLRDVAAPKEFPPETLIRAYAMILNEIVLPATSLERAFRDFTDSGLIARWIRRLSCPFPNRRKEAAARLGLFPAAPTKFALVNRLRVEPLAHVRIYLINALKGQMDQLTLEIIIRSVVGSKRFYQTRAAQVIKNYILSSRTRLPDLFNSDSPEIKELFVEVAEGLRRPDFLAALEAELAAIERQKEGVDTPAYRSMTPPRLSRIRRRVLAALVLYGREFDTPSYLRDPDPEIVRIAVASLSSTPTFERIERLLDLADGRIPEDVLAAAIRKIVDADPTHLKRFVELVTKRSEADARRVLARILANKFDYFVLRTKNAPEELALVVRTIAACGLDASVIRFLNLNRDAAVEAALLPLVKRECDASGRFLADVTEFLDEPLLRKIGLRRQKTKAPAKDSAKPDPAKKRWLLAVLAVAILFFPLLFLLFDPEALTAGGIAALAVRYDVFVNKASVVYYLTANLVYLALAALSIAGASKQRRLWDIKPKAMLYERGMLSSISVIAPAYNEEVTIVESVNSLLNLKYPDYEVVVVNDGSKDGTLERLIEYFRLERKNVPVGEALATRPIRAVYANRSIPNLLVVDKANGGKADALNVGINFATREYVCGIDADSLLEPDALLKVMSTTLDHDEVTFALGGNIFPSNGCEVDRGIVEKTGLSKKWLPLAQTIEYLRAFTLGRIGWGELNGLLIISGAFGLFERRILTEVGGYLTVATFRKDTVGEDMELVVRITRRAIERKLPYRIGFVHNADCFTEVPERMGPLLRQRNRWQRGLLDILSYHRRMILNPRYRTAGTAAMPYFLFFETIGPLLEIQTYLALVFGFAFGILAVEIALLMFTVTIVLGMFLSMTALLVAEKHLVYLSAKDTWRLIGLAVAENFGRRQFWSLYRVRGFFAAFRDNASWGAMARVGFKK